MSNVEERSVYSGGGRVLKWLTLVLGAALFAAVAWLLVRPALAAASGEVPEAAVSATAQPSSVDANYAVYGTAADYPHPAAPDGTAPLDCLSCHKQTLNYHDKLGAGNRACYACHVSTDWKMDTLQLPSGAVIPKDESSQLCGQCHQDRYNAWNEGTHGIPGTVAAIPCIACHNPHQPQVEFLNITKPPMPPVHTPPPLPKDLAIILGISVACLIAGAIILARRRENP